MAQLQPTGAIPVQKVLVIAAVTIASGQTVSAAISCNGLALVGLQLPTALTGTAFTFQGSLDGLTFQSIHSLTTSTALSYTVSASIYAAIDPTPFNGLVAFKIVSGTAEAAARSFTAALKGF